MDSTTSSKAFLDIFEYFQYVKKPSESQIEQWHEKVRFIPNEAVDWIVSQITDGDKMPRNLPKEIIKQWYNYRKAHKEKTIPEQYDYCEDCGGHGTHLFRKLEDVYNPPMWISYVAMCSKCDNWKKQFGSVCREGGYIHRKNSYGNWVPMTDKLVPKVWSTTRQEIIDKGFKYLDQHDPREKILNTSINVDELARGIAKGV